MKKTYSTFSLFTLWFGAAVSLAEIMTGSLLAPLGLEKGLLAIVLGHLAGGLFLALAALIGQQEKMGAMESSRFSLGKYGPYLLAFFNILQLVGWTAIMLIQASNALVTLTHSFLGTSTFSFFILILGSLVFLWALKMGQGSMRLNTIASGLLFILSLLMLGKSLLHFSPILSKETLSFGLAFELSFIMPLSWAPLIADYTQHARSKQGAVWGSYWGYFLGSTLMYLIGLICALQLESIDPSSILLKLKLGLWALLAVFLATITTTFMDVYSAAISTLSIFPRLSKTKLLFFFSAMGTVLALFFPMSKYENFLYMIGSLFAPTFTVLFVDYFWHKKDYRLRPLSFTALLSIVLGVGCYYDFQARNLWIGASLPTILVTALSTFILYRAKMLLLRMRPKKIA